METLGGFPNPRPLPATLHPARFARPRALWLRRAKPGSAYAIHMETLGGFPNPRPLPATLHPARFARPRALWLRRAKLGSANATASPPGVQQNAIL
jgi:hypothetical protein